MSCQWPQPGRCLCKHVTAAVPVARARTFLATRDVRVSVRLGWPTWNWKGKKAPVTHLSFQFSLHLSFKTSKTLALSPTCSIYSTSGHLFMQRSRWSDRGAKFARYRLLTTRAAASPGRLQDIDTHRHCLYLGSTFISVRSPYPCLMCIPDVQRAPMGIPHVICLWTWLSKVNTAASKISWQKGPGHRSWWPEKAS